MLFYLFIIKNYHSEKFRVLKDTNDINQEAVNPKTTHLLNQTASGKHNIAALNGKQRQHYCNKNLKTKSNSQLTKIEPETVVSNLNLVSFKPVTNLITPGATF